MALMVKRCSVLESGDFILVGEDPKLMKQHVFAVIAMIIAVATVWLYVS